MASKGVAVGTVLTVTSTLASAIVNVVDIFLHGSVAKLNTILSSGEHHNRRILKKAANNML